MGGLSKRIKRWGEKSVAAYDPFGGLAQLGEHLLCKQGVVGSIPSSSTTDYGLCLVMSVRGEKAGDCL